MPTNDGDGISSCLKCGELFADLNITISDSNPLFCSICAPAIDMIHTTITKEEEIYNPITDTVTHKHYEGRRITFNGASWLNSKFAIENKTDMEIRKVIEIQRAHIHLMEMELLERKVKLTRTLFARPVHGKVPKETTSTIIHTTSQRTQTKTRVLSPEENAMKFIGELRKQKISPSMQQRLVEIMDKKNRSDEGEKK